MLVGFGREALDRISRLRIEVWRCHLEMLGVVLEKRRRLGQWKLLKPNVLVSTSGFEMSTAARFPYVVRKTGS